MTTPTVSARPRWQIILLLMAIATIFGSNHIAARVAFDHGASVYTAVLIRSAGTTLALAIAIALTGLPGAVSRGLLGKAAFAGLLVSLQSLCLYSAVARIPVGLALLTFNTFPFLFAVLTWIMDRRRPSNRTLAFMPVALIGLALALLLGDGRISPSAGDMVTGIALALTASFIFSWTLYLTQRWLTAMDGRMRSLMIMATTSIVIGMVGLAVDGFSAPTDWTGWLGIGLLTLFYGTAFSALFVVLPRYGILDNAVALNFEPVATLVMGVFILGQAITSLQWLGAAIVLFAMFGLASERRAPPKPK